MTTGNIARVMVQLFYDLITTGSVHITILSTSSDGKQKVMIININYGEATTQLQHYLAKQNSDLC